MIQKEREEGYCFRTFAGRTQTVAIGCHLLRDLPRRSPTPVWRDYAGLLVVDGSGSYEDSDGSVCPLEAGCFVQHLPGRRHVIRRDCPRVWLEWSLFLSGGLFAPMRELGVMDAERPLWRLRHPALLARRYQQLQELLRQAKQSDLPEVLVRVQQLLLDLRRDARDAGPEDPVARACALLAGDLACRLRPNDIADETGVSYPHLRRIFARRMQLSMTEYRNRCRMEQAAALVMTGGRSCAQIARELGYCDQFAFSRQFRAFYGVPPRRYRTPEDMQ